MIHSKTLQFITDGSNVLEIIGQVNQVLDGGCRWIQIRMKEFDDKDIEKVLEAVAPLCKEVGAVCIMNDRVDMAANFHLDGVHLGKEDMCVQEARQILGEDAIIGVTANTIEDIFELSQQPMNYFGIGPMRFTNTKKKLSPVIGLDGYHKIVSAMREIGITKPAVAVGGITLNDVYDLLDLGLWGVAVSGAIAHTSNPTLETEKFMEIINKF